MIKIYNINELQDWQKSGNYKNYLWGIRICPDVRLLPFHKTPNVPHSAAGYVNQWLMRKVTISGGVKTIEDTEAMNHLDIDKANGSIYDYYYYKGNIEQIQLDPGLYEYYFKDNNDNEFISDVFLYTAGCLSYDTGGDFNADFNNDFNIQVGSATGGTSFNGLIIESSILPNIFPTLTYADRIFIE